jgi:RNA polymerase sigma-70 factor (ECF subfamily)
MSLDDKTQKAMLKAIPSLRAFAVSLCRNSDRADDLVQETLLRAIAYIESFRPGSNLEAWLFTILRNNFFSDCRRRKSLVEDVDDKLAEMLTVLPEQVGWCIAEDLREAMRKLSSQHRQALALIGESGLTSEEAACIGREWSWRLTSRAGREDETRRPPWSYVRQAAPHSRRA